MDFTRITDGWESRDGAYLVTEVTDPWGNRPTEPIEWAVRVHMFGANSWTTLRAFPTLDEAQTFAATDDSRPVFDDEGLCRWCGTEENYLKDVPTGMFGCRLCDPVRDLSRADDLDWEDVEAFDDPA